MECMNVLVISLIKNQESQLILQKLFQNNFFESINYLYFQEKDIHYETNKDKQIIAVGSEASYRPFWIVSRLSFITSFYAEVFRRYFEVPKLARKTRSILRKKFNSKIYIQINGQTTLWIAERLTKSHPENVYIHFLESCDSFIRKNRLDSFSRKLVLKSFKNILKQAKFIASAAPVTCNNFYYPFNVSQLPNHISSIKSRNTDGSKDRVKNKLIIGVYDSFESEITANSFLSALDSIYWEIDGLIVEIHAWNTSNFPYMRSRIHKNQIVEIADAALDECDLLYMNGHFEDDLKEDIFYYNSQKLNAYSNSITPIFYHGPPNNLIWSFIEKNNLGLLCGSVSEEVIVYNLRKAIYCKNSVNQAVVRDSYHLQPTGSSNIKAFLNL